MLMMLLLFLFLLLDCLWPLVKRSNNRARILLKVSDHEHVRDNGISTVISFIQRALSQEWDV